MSTPESPLLPSEQKIVQNVMMYTNWASIVVCLFTLITYAAFKRDFPRSMPLWLSCSALLLHFCLLIGPMGGSSFLKVPGSGLCTFQGIGIQFSSILCYCWLCCIALHLYMVVVLGYSNTQVKDYVIWIYVGAFGTPTIFALIPAIKDNLEWRGFWCWISQDDGGAWEFGAYYGPLVLLILITSFCWVTVLIKVSNRLKTSSYIIQTSIGIFLFLASLVLQFVHRVLLVVYKWDSFSLEVIHALTNSSIGIFVFLIFGFTYDNVLLYRDFYNCSNRGFELNVNEEQESSDPSRNLPSTPPSSTTTFKSSTAFTPMKNTLYKGYATTGSFTTPENSDVQGGF